MNTEDQQLEEGLCIFVVDDTENCPELSVREGHCRAHYDEVCDQMAWRAHERIERADGMGEVDRMGRPR